MGGGAAWKRERGRARLTERQRVVGHWLLALVFDVLDDPSIPTLTRIELAQRILRGPRRPQPPSREASACRCLALAKEIDRLFQRLVGDTYTRWTVSDQVRRAIVAYDKGRAGQKEAAVAREAGIGSARRLRRWSLRVFGCLPTGEPAGASCDERSAATIRERVTVAAIVDPRV